MRTDIKNKMELLYIKNMSALKKHGFELHGSMYMWIFSTNSAEY